MIEALLLQRLLAGQVDGPEVAQWVLGGFVAWYAAGGTISLTKALGLPDNPETCKRQVRDLWLVKAACELPEPRAKHLSEGIQRNEHRLVSWVKDGGLPDDATRVMIALYYAFRSGAEIPTSSKQLARIISGHVSGKCVQTGMIKLKSKLNKT